MSEFASVDIQAFLQLCFFKGCENKCNYYTAQQFKMIKKERRAEHSGDVETMMNKSFLGWASSHSTCNLTTGTHLPKLGRRLIEKGGASSTRLYGAQPVAPDPVWVGGVPSHRPALGGHTQAAVFTSFALPTVMTAVTYEVSAES